MADRVLPFVRMVIPCDLAYLDLATGQWTLTNPRTTSFLPEGVSFPFRESELWVYAQLTHHLGAFDLAVVMRQLRKDGTYRAVGWGGATRVVFKGDRLATRETAFGLKNAPFREEGLYEYRLLALTDAGPQLLDGQTAELRVLDRGHQL